MAFSPDGCIETATLLEVSVKSITSAVDLPTPVMRPTRPKPSVAAHPFLIPSFVPIFIKTCCRNPEPVSASTIPVVYGNLRSNFTLFKSNNFAYLASHWIACSFQYFNCWISLFNSLFNSNILEYDLKSKAMFCKVVRGVSKKLKFGTNLSITANRIVSARGLSNLQSKNSIRQKIIDITVNTRLNRPV